MSDVTLRVVRNLRDNFTMIDNDFARNPKVSARAARLFIYLASHNTGWKLSIPATIKATGMGRNTVFGALNDLRELGYVKRYQIVDADNRFAGKEYQVFDLPLPDDLRDDVTAETDPRIPVSRVPESGTRDEQGEYGETAGHSRVPKNGIPKSGIPKTGTLKKTNSKEDQPEEHKKEQLGHDEHDQGALLSVQEFIDPDETPEARFDKWWAMYPRKVQKKDARRKFIRLMKDGVDFQALMDGLARSMRSWEREGRSKDRLPHPTTWLNQERWDDEETMPEDVLERHVQRQPSANDVARQMIQRMNSNPGGGWRELGQ